MEVGKNNVVYMGLVPGPNKADNICGKTKVTGKMQWGSTVHCNDILTKPSSFNRRYTGNLAMIIDLQQKYI
jgi:hypothetical protein